MTREIATIIDFIRLGASRFEAAGLTLGHGHGSPIDEASHLVLSALHLPPDLPPAYGTAHLLDDECRHLHELIARRVEERVPVAYLVGEAWFAGMKFHSDQRALVPRSPFAELIENGFSPWLDGIAVSRALDLCTGSGCIGLAMAEYQPDWQVDLADISADALNLARENLALHGLEGRAEVVESDLFDHLQGRRYDLIVSNPPYVGEAEYAGLAAEYGHEPKLGLTSGEDGLDLCLRMLVEAPDHLTDEGVLMVEVGNSEYALCEVLPQVPFMWIEFSVGQMGVFVISRGDLVEYAAAIAAVRAARHA